MIAYRDAIAAARRLIGTPYAQLDCINLIKRVIRTAPGGVSGYTTAGTNALWKSYTMSAKYRDLTWRQEGISGARAGMLVFKRSGEDVHHVGLVTGDGTVIHSSSVNGRGVVETPLTQKEGWNLLAKHRYIDTAESGETEEREMLYRAKAKLNDETSRLNLRRAPESGQVIGTLAHGDIVDVLAYGEGWAHVSTCTNSGYASMAYLERIDDADTPVEAEPKIAETAITIVDEEGNTFTPQRSFRVLIGDVD